MQYSCLLFKDAMNMSFECVPLHIPCLSPDSAAEYSSVSCVTSGPHVEHELSSLNIAEQLTSAIVSSVRHDWQAISILDEIKVRK